MIPVATPKGSGLAMAMLLWAAVSPAQAGNPFRGEPLYQAQCKGCHGERGHQGIPGTPDFSWRGGSKNGLMQSDLTLLERIKHGGRRCPAFMGILTDQQILDILSHVRTFN